MSIGNPITILTKTTDELRQIARTALQHCGAEVTDRPGTGDIDVRSPITGDVVLSLPQVGAHEIEAAIEAAHEAFLAWRVVPAPMRGRLVKRFGELLTEHKEPSPIWSASRSARSAPRRWVRSRR